MRSGGKGVCGRDDPPIRRKDRKDNVLGMVSQRPGLEFRCPRSLFRADTFLFLSAFLGVLGVFA